jgi:hypothetical protein
MHLSDLLKQKLQQDLLNDFKKYYHKNNIQMNYKIYNKIITKKINKKIKDITFLNPSNHINEKESDTRCCARIWDNHYGTRCKYKRITNEEYCKHHMNMINKTGNLLFNRYDEDKPLFNNKHNPIPWLKKSKIELLDEILKKQWRSLEKSIKNDLYKQRQITP